MSLLEQSLAGQPNYTTSSASLGQKGGEWVLVQSGAVWKALESCWKKDVYIAELAPRFWRLSLQVSEWPIIPSRLSALVCLPGVLVKKKIDISTVWHIPQVDRRQLCHNRRRQ